MQQRDRLKDKFWRRIEARHGVEILHDSDDDTDMSDGERPIDDGLARAADLANLSELREARAFDDAHYEQMLDRALRGYAR